MKEFDEMFKDLEEKFEEEEGKLKKFLKKAGALFMMIIVLFLFLSYLGPGYQILNILEGQAASEDLTSGTLNFEEDVYGELKEMYYDNLDKEFKVCLFGERKGGAFFVNRMEVPRVIERSFASVRAELCPTDSLISLHKHPFKSCIFSEQDIRYYEAYKKTKDNAVIALMCEPDRFNFFGL